MNVHAIRISTLRNDCAECILVPMPNSGRLSTSPTMMARHPMPTALEMPLVTKGMIAGIYT